MRLHGLATILAFVTLAGLGAACSDDNAPAADAAVADVAVTDTPVSTIDSSTPTIDSSTPTIDSSTPTVDAHPADAAPPTADAGIGINCEGTICTGANPCCVSTSAGTAGCSTDGTCASGDIPATCDGPEDCTGAGQACCVAMGMSTSVSCAAATGCIQVVHTADQCPAGIFCPVFGIGGYCWTYTASCPY